MEMPDLIGPYVVERRLGGGSFATVWLVRDHRLDAYMAAKVLADNWSYDDEVKRRFEQEARILWQLDDDHIIRVHTVGELPDGRPYFVMDFADGGTLETRMQARARDQQPYDVDEAVDLSVAIADGLAVAHDAGVIHRDLKPSNVLFRRRRGAGGGEQLVLADFGIARQLEAAKAYTISAGTPWYMSPEQSRPETAGKADKRSDIYSAAVILYELLAGKVPFPHDSMASVVVAQVSERPPPLRSVREDVPRGIERVIERGLKPNPDDRYQSVEEWRQALQQRGDTTPVSSAAATVIERPVVGGAARKTHGRRPLIVAAAAAVLVLALVAGLLLTRKSGPATGPAGLLSPHGIALDGDGNLYVADTDHHRVRKVSENGQVTTFAGNGRQGDTGDGGPAASALLDNPDGLALLGDRLYISNYDRVRVVDGNGQITTAISLDEEDRRQLGDVSFSGAFVASGGAFYLPAGPRIVKATDDGHFVTVVGSDTAGFSGDGGPAADAKLQYATALDADRDGNIYIADADANRIRKIDSSGRITTIAGTGDSARTGDGGPALSATFDNPRALAEAPGGGLFVVDYGNNRVRKISSDGRITTVA